MRGTDSDLSLPKGFQEDTLTISSAPENTKCVCMYVHVCMCAHTLILLKGIQRHSSEMVKTSLWGRSSDPVGVEVCVDVSREKAL